MSKVKSYDAYTRSLKYSNPYSDTKISSNSEVSNMMYNVNDRTYLPIENKRGMLDRVFDLISTPQYATTGIVRGLVDKDLSVIDGFTGGLRAGLDFFGEGYEKGEHTYSKVLESAGWKPESTLGKFAKGTIGFLGDVFLDPSTYISGGTSALFRGSGKAGVNATHDVAKIAEKLGGEVYEQTIKKFATNKNINKELVERLATKKSKELVENITKNGLEFTDDIAKTVIKSFYDSKGLSIGAEELAKDSESLAKLYNKVIGIRNNNVGSTLSLANAPFGKKIFGKYADNSIELVSKEALEKFGDKTIAPYYAKLRDSIYGSRLGKMFSSNSGLYRLSKESPEKVYEVLKYADTVRGLNIDIKEAEKLIRENAKSFTDLTPAETKEILNLMQDKSQWKTITNTVKFLDTQEGKHYQVQALKQQAEAQAKLDELLDVKKNVDALRHATDNQLFDAQNALDLIGEEYRKTLMELDTEKLTKSEQIKSLIKTYEDEIASIQKEVYGKSDEAVVGKLLENYDGYSKTREISNIEKQNFNELKDILQNQVKSDNVVRNADTSDGAFRRIINSVKKNGFVEYKSTKSIDNFASNYPDWEKVIKEEIVDGKKVTSAVFYPPKTFTEKISKGASLLSPDVADTITSVDKRTMVREISEYIYGKPDMLSPAMWDNNLDELVGLIKEGTSKESLMGFIEKNIDFYSGKAQDVYSFIAEQLKYGSNTNYKNWDEFYNKRLEKVYNKINKANGVKTLADEKLLLELEKAKMTREYWLSRFKKAESSYDVMEIIRQHREKELDKIWDEVKDYAHSTAKFPKSATDDMRDKWLVDPMNTSSKKLFTNQDEVIKEVFNIDNQDDFRSIVYNKIFEKHNLKSEKLSDAYIKWANEVTNEVEPLLNNFFKTDYAKLSDKQKEALYNMAVRNASVRKEGGKLVGGIDEKTIKAIADESKRRLERMRVDGIRKQVTEGATIEAVLKDKTIKGVVQEITVDEFGLPNYKILDESGKVIEGITPKKVQSVFVDKSTMKTDDLIKVSDVTNDFVNRQDDLAKLLEESKNALKSLDDNYKTRYSDMVNDFSKRSLELKNQIKDLEVSKKHLDDALKAGDLAEINTLTEKLKKMDDALSSSDAFETHIRSWLGDDKVDDILKKNSPDVGKIVLDTNTSVDEKVKEIAKTLREEFIRFGTEEVEIGKLRPEQFEALMMDYVPHIITDEGYELISKNIKEIEKKIPQFGDDLGYGRRFNEFSMSRTIKYLPDGNGGWIKNPTIEQINEFFEPMLKGKNFFSESISDIYLTRALKHNELMYDNKYMQNMLEVFGKDYTGAVEEGYNTVMNYGKLRETTTNIGKLNTALDISDAVGEFTNKELLKTIDNMVIAELGTKGVTAQEKYLYKKRFNEILGDKIEEFLKTNYTDEVRKGMFDSNVKSFSESNKTLGLLDELSIPMVQLNEEQIKGIKSSFDTTIGRYTDNIKNSLLSFERSRYFELYDADMPVEMAKKISNMNIDEVAKHIEELKGVVDDIDMNRLNRIVKKIDTLNSVNPVQVKQVNDVIVQKANQARKLQIAKDQSRFLQMYDKFTHFIKLNQTTVLPSFHARNKISNTFQNWLGIGVDAVNPEFQKQTFLAMKNKGNIDDVLNITKADGTVSSISWRELYDVAMSNGVIDDGYFAKDIGAGAMSSGKIKNLPSKFDPTDTKNFILYKKGSEIGSLIEGQDRLLHFASQISKGMSVEDAVESVNKFLFDYSDLTAFEASVMKRIFPYYTWLRKNSALQLEMMLEQPKKYLYVSKVMGGVEGMVNEEDRINRAFVNDFAKDWVQTPFHVTNPDGRQEPVLWNPNLPYMDLSRIPDPFNLKSSIPEMFTQTNPLIKTPIEQLMNRNVFFDSPIVKDGENQVTKRANHVASQFGLYGVAGDFIKKDGVDLGLHAMNTTTGLKFLSYDYDKYKAMKIQELIKKQKEGKKK